TCSSLREYQVENEPLPEVGDVSIVLDESDEPKCIIENTKVYTMKYSDVDEEIAFKEGEGDRTLEYWRKDHLKSFEWLYKEIGYEFNEDEEIVVEEFKMLYKYLSNLRRRLMHKIIIDSDTAGDDRIAILTALHIFDVLGITI